MVACRHRSVGYPKDNVTSSPPDGQTHERTTAPLHVGNKEQEHQTRVAGQKVPVQPWLSLQAQSSSSARASRPRPPQVQDRHLRKRMLLARPWRLQILRPPQKQRELLASKSRAQQGQGCRRAPQTHRHGMALHHSMGMPVETKSPPTDSGITCPHLISHLPTKPCPPLPHRRATTTKGCRGRTTLWRKEFRQLNCLHATLPREREKSRMACNLLSRTPFSFTVFNLCLLYLLENDFNWLSMR